MARLLSLIVFAGLVTAASTSNATVIIYTNQAAWNAAVGAGTIVTETYDGAEINPIVQGDATPGNVGHHNVTYITGNGANNSAFKLNELGTTSRLQLKWDTIGDNTTTSVDINYAAAIGAFAADWASVDIGEGLTVTIDGQAFDIDAALGGTETGFVGFASDSNLFTNISFDGGVNDQLFRLRNSYTSTSIVPEPSTVASMVMLGLVGLAVAGRRNSRRRNKS